MAEFAEVRLHATTLRYFEPAGPFAAAVAAVTGTPLPPPLTATVLPDNAAAGAGVVFAWLRPTETLALCEAAAPLAELRDRLAEAAGGHAVDVTGALRGFRVAGAQGPELLCRLGSTALGLRAGDARRGRLADVPVLVLSVRAGETLLVVDRTYAQHLRGWIEATLAECS